MGQPEIIAGKTMNAVHTPATERQVCVVVGEVLSDAARIMNAVQANVQEGFVYSTLKAGATYHLIPLAPLNTPPWYSTGKRFCVLRKRGNLYGFRQF